LLIRNSAGGAIGCSQFDRMLQQSSIQPSLADLSRNASVISTSSSDSSLLKSPLPRPLRTFSAPRSRSPQPPPNCIAQELSYNPQVPSPQKHRSKSRAREATPDDFKFGPTLGSGSYSEATHPFPHFIINLSY
jgi:3-phosphoinositide dependent protein kinase-1